MPDSEYSRRLFVKITRENLPQVKDRYPYLYLERGRLEVDDSSVKWIDCDGAVLPLPIGTVNCLLLGPGTTVTHEAIKVASASNCGISWVGEDSMLFFASGITPTSNTRNFLKQVQAAADSEKSLQVAKRMFARRFPGVDLRGKTLQEMMGMEGTRVRMLYARKASQYAVRWKGRRFTPGRIEDSDTPNRILTAANAALYGILCSSVHAMGFSPHIGFIHSGSPLPFIYDMADLYKENLCIDLAFSMTAELNGQYDRQRVAVAFRQRVLDSKLLESIGGDIEEMLGE